MSYYSVFGLTEEPFSTSPDPAFFYESLEHHEALVRLEISIKLKRGSNVVLGDVGTGKTTLARKLYSLFSEKSKFDFGIILDPSSESELGFWEQLADAFEIKAANPAQIYDYRKALESYLSRRGVEEGKTVILSIDEAQKLNGHSIEVLRTLLNYETNKFKLLQLVLFGQLELLNQIREQNNFWDRVALKYVLNSLSERETKELVEFRLKQAGYKGGFPLFADPAIHAIFEHTQGLPRRIMLICHNALEALVIQNKERVDEALVQTLIQEEAQILNVKQ